MARNNVFPLLLNQNSSEKRINIVVTSSQDEKTKNIIESEIFKKPKTVHLAIIGHGNVGKTLIEQVLHSSEEIKRRKNIHLKVVAVANSRKIAFNKKGFDNQWSDEVFASEKLLTLKS